MKALFVYNPNSGKGKLKKKLHYIEKRLKSRYDRVDIVVTKSVEELESVVQESCGSYDAVIFSGGDGTFNHVVQGISGAKTKFGYIPSGTVNDVARSLHIPRTLKGALKVILKDNTAALDVMKAGDDYIMYIAAAGAFTSASYSTPQKQKRVLGTIAYAIEGLKHNMKLEVFPLKVTSGGQTVETSAVLIFVLNGRSVAGFPINKKGSMCDGTLETVIIKQAKKPNLFQRIGALFSLATLFIFGCSVKKRDIVTLKGDRVEIETEDHVVWAYDGEKGCSGRAVIEVIPQKIQLFVPKNKKI